jgi:hypothetical protein
MGLFMLILHAVAASSAASGAAGVVDRPVRRREVLADVLQLLREALHSGDVRRHVGDAALSQSAHRGYPEVRRRETDRLRESLKLDSRARQENQSSADVPDARVLDLPNR